VTDIGSGLNEDRKGFKKILKLATEKKISKIVVAYPDRLTRFGFKILKELLSAFGVEVVILNHEDKDPRKELVEDLINDNLALRRQALRHEGPQVRRGRRGC